MNTALKIVWKDFVESPSRKDGISQHVERYLRADTCKFIDEFGSMHKVHGWSGTTRLLACALFHTFYLSVSFKAVNRWETAIACLTLARKAAPAIDDPAARKTRHAKPHRHIFTHVIPVDKSGPNHMSNTNRLSRAFIRSAAEYLRVDLKEVGHEWASIIRWRELHISQSLRYEFNMKLPIERKVGYLYSAPHLHPIIVNEKGMKFPTSKNKNLSLVYRGCFDVLKIMYVPSLSVLASSQDMFG